MIQMINEPPQRHYRTIWISDLHLGAKSSRPDCLLDFFRHHQSEHLYLVGDMIDGWRLKKSWFWDQLHNDVVQKILRQARKGTQVVYIPGNHDQFARDHIGLRLGEIEIKRNCEHVTADGRRLLIMHGDEFDSIVTHAKWLAVLGSGAYEASIVLNRIVNGVREKLGMPYWSISNYLKQKVKNAMKFIDNYEQAVAEAGRQRKVDGVVCGHIHRADIKTIEGIEYYNTGDWVESCTALVEHFDGRMELIEWVIPKSGKRGHSSRKTLSIDAPSAENAKQRVDCVI
ncbi:UDP-2,3-diacylglucosamine diphosphatase [Kiritimatiellota bacterium B12222]|nr:UDP-2,3-diacylglucosamine diphosphatase [Kiritimatiellota bacterium B12222]